MKYTEGPWTNDEGTIYGKGGSHLAVVSDINDFPCLDADSMHPEEREDVENEMKGNADLIALTPELAEAIRLILPLAKGYAAANRVGSNAEYIRTAEDLMERVEKVGALTE